VFILCTVVDTFPLKETNLKVGHCKERDALRHLRALAGTAGPFADLTAMDSILD
jgi:hypothetical protein